MSLEQRIRAAMRGRELANYWCVMREVFPAEQYPRAWRYSQNGGPPGCAMAFGAAIRRMGGHWNQADADRRLYIPATTGKDAA